MPDEELKVFRISTKETEHVEKVVTKARGDIEAMAMSASQGNPFLVQPAPSVAALLEGSKDEQH